MYCPRCGSENLNEASFCRACGADISLVPHALTGRLPVTQDEAKDDLVKNAGGKAKRRKEKKEKEGVEDAAETFFTGLAFLLIVIGGAIFFTRGFMIWIWFVIPAFACIGSGVGKYLRAKQERELQVLRATHTLPSSSFPLSPPRAPLANSLSEKDFLPVRDTEEIAAALETAPASVTEGTTRLLDETPDRRSVTTPARANRTEA